MADFQWKPVSATAQPHESLAQKAEMALKRLANSPVTKAVSEFEQLPAEGVTALLGAPQRVVAQRLAQMRTNPRGVAETAAAPLFGPVALMTPEGRKEAGNEVYAAFHPNDLGPEEAAERAVGVSHLMSTDPRLRGKLQNFAVRTGFETLTDPLTFTGAGTAAAGEDALRAFGRAGTRALTSPNETVRNTAKNFLTNVEEREGGFTPSEIATINTIKQRGITRSRVMHTSDEALLHANQSALRNGVIPDAVRQRLLREPYLVGTPEMREQAVAMGFKPTPAESATQPLGLLDYNLKEEYSPATGAWQRQPQAFNDLLLGEEAKLREPTAGFEKHQTSEADPATLYDRVSQRLAAGRAVIRHRSTTDALQREAGVGPEMAHSLATEPKIGGVKALQDISRAQVDALLSTGLPHMRNVGVAGYLAMGEPGMADAARMMITGVPKELTDRLEQGGASHFGVRTPGKFSPARLLPLGVRKATTGMLDRWDTALRAARLKQLDREMPKATEYERLDRVNQDLGAYNLKPQYVKWLQAFAGANFPQWHNYIVPTMVGRALIRNPGRIERLARTEQNANDAFLPNAKYRITLGGPVDESASAAADVARIMDMKYPTYFGGPSSLGPASYIFHPPPGKVTAPQRALEVGSGFVPFGGTALDVLLNPYKSPLPPLARAAGGLTGVYSQKRPPGSRARTAPSLSTLQTGSGTIWSVPQGASKQPSPGFNWTPASGSPAP
jgi:hypothetical protein